MPEVVCDRARPTVNSASAITVAITGDYGDRRLRITVTVDYGDSGQWITVTVHLIAFASNADLISFVPTSRDGDN
jgi:hypothetical protein